MIGQIKSRTVVVVMEMGDWGQSRGQDRKDRVTDWSVEGGWGS